MLRELSQKLNSSESAFARHLDLYVRFLTLEQARSPHTVAAYSKDLAEYFDYLEGLSVRTPDSVTAAIVRNYVETLVGAPRTVARKVSSVKNFHRFLAQEGVVSEDLVSALRPPALPNRLPKALSISEVQTLLSSIDEDSPSSIRDKALLEFLYATGARISEALALTVDDVLDESNRSTNLVKLTGKGNKQRIIPVGDFAREALDSYLTRARPVLVSGQSLFSPILFVGNRGAALSRQNAWLILRAASRRAGLGDTLSPHTLRHSFATHVLRGGADVRVVQELLGHSSVSTTQLYTKVTIESLREVYQVSHPRAQ